MRVSKALEGRWPDLPRQTLEAIAVEGYRTGALTESQVRRLLGCESPLRYTEADLEDDVAAHRELRGSSPSALQQIEDRLPFRDEGNRNAIPASRAENGVKRGVARATVGFNDDSMITT